MVIMRKTLIAISSLLLLGIGKTYAQLPMTRTTFTGTYTPITSGGGATTTTITGDDGVQNLIPLGFTFNYLGTNYTTIDACSNGWISFGAAGSNQWANSSMYNNSIPNLTVAAWWDDLNVGTGAVLYQLQGTPGSQTFTIQWTNVNSYNGVTTNFLNFQIILYEGTNVIEFRYGTNTLPTAMVNESASIGLENGTGGAGGFLDAVTGSSFVGQGFLDPISKWPTRFFRFTPGVATPVSGGTYNVGVGQTYPTIDEAFADLCHRGITGAVTLSLTDANYDVTPSGGDNIFPVFVGPISGSSAVNTVTMMPASGTSTLTYNGAVSGFGANSVSQTTFGTSNEPIIGLVGADYTIFNNLNFTTGGNQLDRGVALVNNSATDGSTFNTFQDINIVLNRVNTSSVGISQTVPTTPTSAAGANSNNTYRNLNISNVYSGINLAGNATFPDVNSIIGNTVPTNFNNIGSATANDIGNGTIATYGIQTSNQDGINIYNNFVRNVTVTGGVTVDGIISTGSQGTCNIYNNKIQTISSTSTGSTTNLTGIRSNIANVGTPIMRIYNNFVSDLRSGYTGVATATRQVKGIFLQTGGGGAATQTFEISNNNVSIDATLTPNISSTCLEIGTTAGPIMNIRNNNFANYTGAQTTPALHTTWQSTSATLTGNTGSISNFNNLYVSNTTQGFVGQGATTTYATLLDWQTAMVGMDVNSISTDPGYTNLVTDLHVNAPPLNAAATPLAWVTVDIDNTVRSGTPDIGADEFTLNTVDMGTVSLASPTSGTCYSATQNVVANIRNYGVAALDFSVNPTTVTVNVTGAITTTLNVTLNDNSLNGGIPLASGATLAVPMGTINMSAAGTYTFNSSTTVVGDGNSLNDNMPTVNINVNYGTAASTPRTICDLSGDPITLNASGFSTGFTIQWQSSPDGSTWSDIVGGTSASYDSGTIADTTWFRVSYCGGVGFSNVDTSFIIPVTSPTTTGDTICGTDTLHLFANGPGTLNWYPTSSGGSYIFQGTNYNVVFPVTDTLWVSNSSAGGSTNTGKPDNTGGGGQQTSTAYNIFDAFSPFNLLGVTVYPGAAGNVVFDLRDNVGTLIQQVTYPVTAGDINNPTFIPLNLAITPGTGYRLAQGTGSVSMYRNSGGVTFPYTVPGIVSITNSSAGTTFYYFGYNWLISTGCESPRTPVVGVVNTPPAISAVAGNATICEEDTTTLTVTSLDPTYSYLWNNGTTLSNPNSANTNAYPSVSTTYIVQASNPVGCITYDTVSIAVNPLPVGALSITDTIICIGDSAGIQFSAPGGIFTDSTAFPILDNTTNTDTMIVSGQTTFITITTIDSVCLNGVHTWTSDVDLTLISPNGTQLLLMSAQGGSADNFTQVCFSPNAVTSIVGAAAPFTGTWIPEGAGGFSVFNGENANGNWILSNTDNAAGDQGSIDNWTIWFHERGYSYAWSSSTSGTLPDTTDSINANPIVTTVYTVNVTDTVTGCTKAFPITLQVRDSLQFTILGNTNLCPGDSTQLIAVGTGGDGNYSWLWSDGIGTNDTTGYLNIPFTYTLGLSLNDGCNTPTYVDSVTINVALNNVLATVPDTTICYVTDLDLPSVVSGGDGNYTYLWTPGSTTNDSLNLTNVTAGITYTLTVTDGCGFTDNDQSVITVDPLPVANFTSSGSVASFNFNNTSTNATSYSWNFGDSQTSTATSPSHTYTSSGSFTVTLIATNNCGSDTITSTVSSTLGIQNPEFGTVSLYPNPTADFVNLSISNASQNEVLVELYDLNGKLILVKNYILNDGNLTTSFDLTALSSGIYDLRITNNSSSSNYKIVRK